MSWQQAKKEAQRLIDSMQVPRSIRRGGVFDITEGIRRIKHEPKFRKMVIDAVVRILKSRGIDATFKDERGDE